MMHALFSVNIMNYSLKIISTASCLIMCTGYVHLLHCMSFLHFTDCVNINGDEVSAKQSRGTRGNFRQDASPVQDERVKPRLVFQSDLSLILI